MLEIITKNIAYTKIDINLPNYIILRVIYNFLVGRGVINPNYEYYTKINITGKLDEEIREINMTFDSKDSEFIKYILHQLCTDVNTFTLHSSEFTNCS